MNKTILRPLISVVVCTYNGGRKINKCLDALLNQEYPRYEIIVVNDGSNDDTEAIIKSYPIKIINNSKNMGLSASRNVGIKNAKGEIIAFTDDDCMPKKTWLSGLSENYDNKNIAAVGGIIVPANVSTSIILKYLKARNPLTPLELSILNSNNIFYRLYLYLLNLFIDSNKLSNKREVYSLVGANMSFRKKVLNEISFDNEFRFGSDEEDLFKRIHIQLKNVSIVLDPDIIVNHNFDLEISSILKRQFKYGQGNAKMYFKHLDHNPTIFPFPFIYIFLLTLVFFMPIYMLLFIFSPNILYINWTLKFIQYKNVNYLIFPYLQILIELFSNLGFIYTYLIFKFKYD